MRESVVWLIPCYNEAKALPLVLEQIRRHCPEGRVVVFDNNSTDGTGDIARRLGAEVYVERRQGKGYVVSTMFEAIEADVYILIDGDATYDVSAWRRLAEPVIEMRADMVVATRLQQHADRSFRALHFAGNHIITRCIGFFFRAPLVDVLSGYRCFSRRFVKGIPLHAKGFEIETELTIQCLENRFRILEIEAAYGARPAGSVSKLNTFHDGFLIFYTIFRLVKDYKPLTFFGSVGVVAAALCLALGLATDWDAGVVLTGVFALSSLFTGIVLNATSQRAKELAQLIRKNAAPAEPLAGASVPTRP